MPSQTSVLSAHGLELAELGVEFLLLQLAQVRPNVLQRPLHGRPATDCKRVVRHDHAAISECECESTCAVGIDRRDEEIDCGILSSRPLSDDRRDDSCSFDHARCPNKQLLLVHPRTPPSLYVPSPHGEGKARNGMHRWMMCCVSPDKNAYVPSYHHAASPVSDLRICAISSTMLRMKMSSLTCSAASSVLLPHHAPSATSATIGMSM